MAAAVADARGRAPAGRARRALSLKSVPSPRRSRRPLCHLRATAGKENRTEQE
eukprot:gene21176-11847_t